jgi:Baseplate J-like protein
MVSAYILSAVVVLVAALGSLIYSENATVKLSVPPQKLVATAQFSAGQTSGDLKTQHIGATVTQALAGTAMTVLVDATYATGNVVFSYSCKSATCPSGPLTLPSGTLVTTANSLAYTTQAPAAVKRPTGSATVAVRATAPGTFWNTGKSTITVINENPDLYLHVTNPAAVAGARDAHSAPVIQQSDWDSVVTALTSRVTAALDISLKTKAFQMSYIANGPPLLTMTSDHKVGDVVRGFTITMTGTIGATAFSDIEAQALMRAAFDAKVPPGQQLIGDSIETTWQILQASPNGDLVVNGTAVGFVAPKVSTDTLRSQIRGLSLANARKALERAVPGSKVEIRISPVAVPWLPLFKEHISLTVVIQPIGE